VTGHTSAVRFSCCGIGTHFTCTRHLNILRTTNLDQQCMLAI
jgi:hypothetical protein